MQNYVTQINAVAFTFMFFYKSRKISVFILWELVDKLYGFINSLLNLAKMSTDKI